MDILVVDDDEKLGNLLRLHLEKQEHKVALISTAIDAAVKMVASPWDLILLDWELPDGTGLELCRSYRDCGGLAPVLIMTGRSSIDDKEAGLEAGADDYITKPFEMRELSARVKSLLRRSTQYSQQAAIKELGQGSVISDRYKFLEQIGVGGMANLWLAEDKKEFCKVVVKVIHGHLLGTPDVLKRFDQEWRLLSTVKDPNVVKFKSAGTLKSGTPFLVMEYIDGKPLRQVSAAVDALPLPVVLEWMIEICSGLQSIHNQGIVHRDLKLENIILENGKAYPQSVKIVDFGLAKLMEIGERLTQDNLVVGTLEYLAPEQLKNSAVDGRADIYALGVLMYELLTKTTPFRGSTPEQVLAKHLSEEAARPSSLRQDLPPSIDAITGKCLQKSPADRYQKASQMQEELLQAYNCL